MRKSLLSEGKVQRSVVLTFHRRSASQLPTTKGWMLCKISWLLERQPFRDPIWLEEGLARLKLSQMWLSFGNILEAKEEVSRAEILYRNGLGSMAEHGNDLDLQIRYAKATVHNGNEPQR